MATKQGQNSIIEYLKARDPELMDKVVSTFATCRKLDFMSIKQSDIMVLTPEQAYKYKGDEGDKYFKIWMAGDKIAWCTWANSMIDSSFRWNPRDKDPKKRRDDTDILGNEPYVSEYLRHWSLRNKCTAVYMFPFSAFISIEVDFLIYELNTLSVDIRRAIDRKIPCGDYIQDFDNKLMQLRCLDENNKMIAHFETSRKMWDTWIGQQRGFFTKLRNKLGL